MQAAKEKLWLRYSGRLLSAASIMFIAVQAARHYRDFSTLSFNSGTLIYLVFAVAYFSAGSFVLALIWRSILAAGGTTLTPRTAYRIMGRSQIAKYIPGNIFHFIGRAAMASKEGIATEPLIVSMGVEVTMSAVAAMGVVLGGVSLQVLPLPYVEDLRHRVVVTIPWGIVGLAIITIIVVSLTSSKVRVWLKSRLRYFKWRTIGLALICQVSLLMANGILISMLAVNAWPDTILIPWYTYSCGFALAFLLGFIVPGAPGGLGIREVVFVALFGGQLGEGLAVGLALLLRIITTCADVVTFFLATLIGDGKKPSSTTT